LLFKIAILISGFSSSKTWNTGERGQNDNKPLLIKNERKPQIDPAKEAYELFLRFQKTQEKNYETLAYGVRSKTGLFTLITGVQLCKLTPIVNTVPKIKSEVNYGEYRRMQTDYKTGAGDNTLGTGWDDDDNEPKNKKPRLDDINKGLPKKESSGWSDDEQEMPKSESTKPSVKAAAVSDGWDDEPAAAAATLPDAPVKSVPFMNDGGDLWD
jgi:hypothetical protein